MYLNKITFIEVSDLAEQPRRAHEINVDNHHMDQIEEVYNQTGNLSKDMITKVFGGAIKPSATDIEDVYIAGGWGGSRYRTLVEVVVEEPYDNQCGRRVILCGYTDRIDVSMDNHVADDTKMFINSIIVVRDDVRVDRSGRTYISSKVIENEQLLNGRYEPANRNSEFTARPQDIFTTIGFIEDMGLEDDLDSDLRIQFNSGARQSRRTNNMGSSYLSTLIEADRESYNDNKYFDTNASVFGESRNNRAETVAFEKTLHGNEVLRALFNVSGNVSDRSIEYWELATLTPHADVREVDEKLTIMNRTNKVFDYHADELNGAFEETVMAVIIANTVPALLAELALMSIEFVCSNADTINGDSEYEVINVNTLVDGLSDCTSLENAFINRFQTDVFEHISKHNGLVLNLNVNSDIAGVTRVSICIGSRDNWMDFVIPSFADSNLAPVITEDVEKVRDIAIKYMAIRKNLDSFDNEDGADEYDRFSGSQPQNMPRRGTTTNSLNSILNLDNDEL